MICDKCKKVFVSGNAPDGTPNGISMMMRDGKKVTFCRTCVMMFGMMSEAKRNAFFEELGVEIKNDGKGNG